MEYNIDLGKERLELGRSIREDRVLEYHCDHRIRKIRENRLNKKADS